MGGTGRTPIGRRGRARTRTHIITFNNNAAACYYILYFIIIIIIIVRALCSAGVCIRAHAPGHVASGRGMKKKKKTVRICIIYYIRDGPMQHYYYDDVVRVILLCMFFFFFYPTCAQHPFRRLARRYTPS